MDGVEEPDTTTTNNQAQQDESRDQIVQRKENCIAEAQALASTCASSQAPTIETTMASIVEELSSSAVLANEGPNEHCRSCSLSSSDTSASHSSSHCSSPLGTERTHLSHPVAVVLSGSRSLPAALEVQGTIVDNTPVDLSSACALVPQDTEQIDAPPLLNSSVDLQVTSEHLQAGEQERISVGRVANQATLSNPGPCSSSDSMDNDISMKADDPDDHHIYLLGKHTPEVSAAKFPSVTHENIPIESEPAAMTDLACSEEIPSQLNGDSLVQSTSVTGVGGYLQISQTSAVERSSQRTHRDAAPNEQGTEERIGCPAPVLVISATQFNVASFSPAQKSLSIASTESNCTCTDTASQLEHPLSTVGTLTTETIPVLTAQLEHVFQESDVTSAAILTSDQLAAFPRSLPPCLSLIVRQSTTLTSASQNAASPNRPASPTFSDLDPCSQSTQPTTAQGMITDRVSDADTESEEAQNAESQSADEESEHTLHNNTDQPVSAALVTTNTDIETDPFEASQQSQESVTAATYSPYSVLRSPLSQATPSCSAAFMPAGQACDAEDVLMLPDSEQDDPISTNQAADQPQHHRQHGSHEEENLTQTTSLEELTAHAQAIPTAPVFNLGVGSLPSPVDPHFSVSFLRSLLNEKQEIEAALRVEHSEALDLLQKESAEKTKAQQEAKVLQQQLINERHAGDKRTQRLISEYRSEQMRLRREWDRERESLHSRCTAAERQTAGDRQELQQLKTERESTLQQCQQQHEQLEHQEQELQQLRAELLRISATHSPQLVEALQKQLGELSRVHEETLNKLVDLENKHRSHKKGLKEAKKQFLSEQEQYKQMVNAAKEEISVTNKCLQELALKHSSTESKYVMLEEQNLSLVDRIKIFEAERKDALRSQIEVTRLTVLEQTSRTEIDRLQTDKKEAQQEYRRAREDWKAATEQLTQVRLSMQHQLDNTKQLLANATEKIGVLSEKSNNIKIQLDSSIVEKKEISDKLAEERTRNSCLHDAGVKVTFEHKALVEQHGELRRLCKDRESELQEMDKQLRIKDRHLADKSRELKEIKIIAAELRKEREMTSQQLVDRQKARRPPAEIITTTVSASHNSDDLSPDASLLNCVLHPLSPFPVSPTELLRTMSASSTGHKDGRIPWTSNDAVKVPTADKTGESRMFGAGDRTGTRGNERFDSIHPNKTSISSYDPARNEQELNVPDKENHPCDHLPSVIRTETKRNPFRKERNDSKRPSALNPSQNEQPISEASVQRDMHSTLPPSSGFPVILLTSLTEEQMSEAKAVISLLGGEIELKEDSTELTTHCLMGIKGTTRKSLTASVRGCWMVDLDWLRASKEAGVWMNEGDYHGTKFTTNTIKDKVFAFHDSFTSLEGSALYPQPMQVDLVRALITAGGGNLAICDPNTQQIDYFLIGYQCQHHLPRNQVFTYDSFMRYFVPFYTSVKGEKSKGKRKGEDVASTSNQSHGERNQKSNPHSGSKKQKRLCDGTVEAGSSQSQAPDEERQKAKKTTQQTALDAADTAVVFDHANDSCTESSSPVVCARPATTTPTTARSLRKREPKRLSEEEEEELQLQRALEESRKDKEPSGQGYPQLRPQEQHQDTAEEEAPQLEYAQNEHDTAFTESCSHKSSSSIQSKSAGKSHRKPGDQINELSFSTEFDPVFVTASVDTSSAGPALAEKSSRSANRRESTRGSKKKVGQRS